MSAILTLLNRDHANFLHLLNAFETQVQVVADGRRPSFHVLKSVLVYFRDYSRQAHHPREELILDLLRKHAPELSGTVNETIDAHRHLSSRLADLEARLESYEHSSLTEQRAFVRAAQEFIAFERAHIAEENQHLIPAAIHHLTAAEWQWADSSVGHGQDPFSGEAIVSPLARIREAVFSTDDHVAHHHAGGSVDGNSTNAGKSIDAERE